MYDVKCSDKEQSSVEVWGGWGGVCVCVCVCVRVCV